LGLDKKVIKQLLKKEDPLILELGAHAGEDTREFIREFKNLKIYCFEPDPRCIKKFKRRIKDNRCVLVEAAISSADGTTWLNLSSGLPPGRVYNLFRKLGLGKCYAALAKDDWDYSSSIKPAVSGPKDYPWLDFKEKTEVKTVRLDSWTKGNNIQQVDFIWSDIQGAEKDMLEGAGDTLKICRYFYTEYGELSSYCGALTREETINILWEHGYELVPAHSSEQKIGNLLFRNRKLT